MDSKERSRVACLVRNCVYLAAFTLLLVFAGPESASASVTHMYDLTTSTPFSDTMGGPSLVPNGGTTTVGTGYVFGAGQGLSLSSALSDPANYGIEMVFKLNNVNGNGRALNGFAKLIDTKNLSSDNAYYDLSGHLDFFNVGSSATPVFANGVYADLLVTRDGATKEIKGSVDGIQVLDVFDTGGIGIFSATNNIIHFFEDDTVAVCSPGGTDCEASSGTVKSITIFDGPLSATPEPGTLALLGGGVLAGWLKRRASSRAS